VQLQLQDLGRFAGLVVVGGDEKGVHATESTTRASFVVESSVCVR
jgi:hypothetical protein